MSPFADTANKRAIRDAWDRPILEARRARIGRPLTYFGLPGPKILDLFAWRDLLDLRRTAVEGGGSGRRAREIADEVIGAMTTNAVSLGLSSGLEILRADIANVILEGMDGYGRRPALSDQAPAPSARFSYDLVNLDFDGGIGYENAGREAKRLRAIHKLFERQRGHGFVLLLTVNVRSTLGKEAEEYLQALRAGPRGEGLGSAIGWHLARGPGEYEYKLKAWVPSALRTQAEGQGFNCLCHPPIVYVGHANAKMIHFAFELTAQRPNLPGVSSQDELALMLLPMVQVVNGAVKLAPLQCEGLDLNACESHFLFLRDEARRTLLGAGG